MHLIIDSLEGILTYLLLLHWYTWFYLHMSMSSISWSSLSLSSFLSLV